MDSQFASSGWMAVALAVGMLVIVLAIPVGAALLRLAVRWLGGFTPGFGICCGTVVVGVGLSWVGNAALFVTLLAIDRQFGGLDIRAGPGQWAYGAAALVIDVAMHVLAVSVTLRRPDGTRLWFGQAIRIAATYLVLAFGLMVAVIGSLAAVFAMLR